MPGPDEKLHPAMERAMGLAAAFGNVVAGVEDVAADPACAAAARAYKAAALAAQRELISQATNAVAVAASEAMRPTFGEDVTAVNWLPRLRDAMALVQSLRTALAAAQREVERYRRMSADSDGFCKQMAKSLAAAQGEVERLRDDSRELDELTMLVYSKLPRGSHSPSVSGVLVEILSLHSAAVTVAEAAVAWSATVLGSVIAATKCGRSGRRQVRPRRRRQRCLEPRYVCSNCNDTHRMHLGGEDADDCFVMCTHCPTPCQRCRAGGKGAFCETTPCGCDCHSSASPPEPAPVDEGVDAYMARNAESEWLPGFPPSRAELGLRAAVADKRLREHECCRPDIDSPDNRWNAWCDKKETLASAYKKACADFDAAEEDGPPSQKT